MAKEYHNQTNQRSRDFLSRRKDVITYPLYFQVKDDPRSYERNLMQLRKEAWKKIQDFNGVWTIG